MSLTTELIPDIPVGRCSGIELPYLGDQTYCSNGFP